MTLCVRGFKPRKLDTYKRQEKAERVPLLEGSCIHCGVYSFSFTQTSCHQKKTPNAFLESKLNTEIEIHDISGLNLTFSHGKVKRWELILSYCYIQEVLLIIIATLFLYQPLLFIDMWHLLWTRQFDKFSTHTISVFVATLWWKDTHFTDEESEACSN